MEVVHRQLDKKRNITTELFSEAPPEANGATPTHDPHFLILPEGNILSSGRELRKYSGTVRQSQRPPHIWPEDWAAMSKKRKKQETEKYQQSVAEAAQGSIPAAAAIASSLLRDREVPEMPTTNPCYEHRRRIPEHAFPFSTMVARPVDKKEISVTPAAQAALDKEWDKLVKAVVWDQSKAYEWDQIADAARKGGETVHVGRIFELCVEKGCELPTGDPFRKFKGRSVFQGNNVKDQAWDTAVFQELGSNPAQMSAVKICDWYGLLKDHDAEQADAEMAYINAKLQGPKTYVRLPRGRLPPQFSGLRDPVFPLLLALYGHPDSGGFWEQHSHEFLTQEGWGLIARNTWKSTYWHPKLKLLLVVYVDDFRMSGPAKALAKGWETITKHINISTPEKSGKFLGCAHLRSRELIPQGGDPWSKYDESILRKEGVWKNVMTYDMEPFLQQCVEKCCELASLSKSALKTVDTPFIDEKQAQKEELAAIHACQDAEDAERRAAQGGANS